MNFLLYFQNIDKIDNIIRTKFLTNLTDSNEIMQKLYLAEFSMNDKEKIKESLELINSFVPLELANTRRRLELNMLKEVELVNDITKKISVWVLRQEL